MSRSRFVTSILTLIVIAIGQATIASAAVTREEVERALRSGVRYLKSQQRADGSWSEAVDDAPSGTTSLVTLALLTAGEPANSPTIARALTFLRELGPEQLNNTYAVSLQTMALAAADPQRDLLKLTANVAWLEKAQIKPGDRVPWPGSWTYTATKSRHGDNSNSQYALLGLNAASEVGVPVSPQVWTLARRYWEECQRARWGLALCHRRPPRAPPAA